MTQGNKPAFPRTFTSSVGMSGLRPMDGNPGMTLREYYAGQAMLGLLSCNGTVLNETTAPNLTPEQEEAIDEIAALAWIMADRVLDMGRQDNP